jgi:hypothetical protein
MIGVIIRERSNLLGKQGMISCTWMKHGLTKITAQILALSNTTKLGFFRAGINGFSNHPRKTTLFISW